MKETIEKLKEIVRGQNISSSDLSNAETFLNRLKKDSELREKVKFNPEADSLMDAFVFIKTPQKQKFWFSIATAPKKE